MGRRAVEQGPVGERASTMIRQLRASRGWSLADLERRLDEAGRPILRSGLSKIESGERRVDVDDLAAFCQVFGVEPSELLGLPTSDSPFARAMRMIYGELDELDLEAAMAEVKRLHMLSTEASHVEFLLLRRLTEAQQS